MAKLTAEQQKQLDELTALSEAPDEPAGGGSQSVLNFTIDLGNDAAVERALKLGILKPGDVEEQEEEGEGEGDPPADDQPRRRLTGADKLMGA